MASSQLSEQVVVEVTGWPEAHRVELREGIAELIARINGANSKVSGAQGWTPEAIDRLLDRLVRTGAVTQARVIETALATGGTVARATVYGIGDYKAERSLKGFTRPVNRVVVEMKAAGEIPEDAVAPLRPAYNSEVKGYQRALGFEVPADLVSMMSKADAR